MSGAETFVVGAFYRVPWSPNPHRLEEIRPQHCQLHGEYIGEQLYLRKRRNSEVRPWGSVSVASPKQEIVPWDGELPPEPQPSGERPESVTELIEILDAAEPFNDRAVFDHTPEEIGEHVMAHYKEIRTALAGSIPPNKETSHEPD